MSSDDIDEDVLYIIHQLVESIDTCDDCSMIDSSVKRHEDLNLCDNCRSKRHEDAQKVLKDLESLAHEVEERLQAIENTERELDQWRDAQLQKNRDFWDGNFIF
jgi:reverse gyrase